MTTDVERRLIEAGLSAAPAPPPQPQQLMVTLNTPQGQQQVPVQIGIFVLLDSINASLVAIHEALIAKDPEEAS